MARVLVVDDDVTVRKVIGRPGPTGVELAMTTGCGRPSEEDSRKR